MLVEAPNRVKHRSFSRADKNEDEPKDSHTDNREMHAAAIDSSRVTLAGP